MNLLGSSIDLCRNDLEVVDREGVKGYAVVCGGSRCYIGSVGRGAGGAFENSQPAGALHVHMDQLPAPSR